jgi:hypothetical protein
MLAQSHSPCCSPHPLLLATCLLMFAFDGRPVRDSHYSLHDSKYSPWISSFGRQFESLVANGINSSLLVRYSLRILIHDFAESHLESSFPTSAMHLECMWGNPTTRPYEIYDVFVSHAVSPSSFSLCPCVRSVSPATQMILLYWTRFPQVLQFIPRLSTQKEPPRPPPQR